MERAWLSSSAPRSSGPCDVICFMVTHLPANGARSPLNSSASMTTIFSICVWGRIDRILCSWWSEDKKMTRQPESSRTNAVCSAVSVVVERNRDRTEQQAGHIGHGPLGPIFAENGDAISGLECPRRAACARCGRRFRPNSRERDRQPLSGLAVQHHAVEIALDGGEENVVQSGDAHCVFRVLGRSLELRNRLRTELYCFAAAWAMRTVTPVRYFRVYRTVAAE